jgi:hypothetical protein
MFADLEWWWGYPRVKWFKGLGFKSFRVAE